ncbi:NO-inducible flavohemoprotein [Rhodocytophaga aerolata]|uniref:Flavohemoprotein n=1 Tax=Rhodocytophaga aerolata TaxID=455078 RepID=A0ABT8RHJ1_9BACT|nr:NO-inducible flavohemoprotein [Rhodocytophaga aerolata]MDO1450849.1 NO-inducible flavohemoprotein [Rhodocytophaga aerolata]
MITNKQKQLVKDTAPILREHGLVLTSHFYRRMFTHHPELKNVFNMGNQQSGKQQTALALAVLAYAENIEDPSVLASPVTKIGHKHVSLDIRPEHYAIVGKHLLASIREVLGDAASDELIDAWAVAYSQLAALMTGVEATLYSQAIAKEGGWTGWRPFQVKEKVKESEEITSFYLYPADGGKVADFLPGQFVSVRLFLPELNLFQPRQYSISNAPNGEYYRISVKKETGANIRPNGMISNRLHEHVKEGDILEMASPAGDFILDTSKEGPVVLISGGVGQTPLISMLEYLISTSSHRDVVWIHGARNMAVHAFKEQITSLKDQREQFQSHIFYDVLDESLPLEEYYPGVVDLQQISHEVILPDAQYYICGPAPFIEKQYKDLVKLGIEKSHIHYEEFGPNVLALP